MKKDEIFWVDIKHNKLTKEQINDNYLRNIIKFVCAGGGYYEEMSEDMIRGLFREAKRRRLNIIGYTLEQALDEYKSGTTTRYKLLTPNYDFPDYGDKLNPAIDSRNVGKNQDNRLMIAVVGLTREELKQKFNVMTLDETRNDVYTDGLNIYICVNDLHTNLWGRRFDKIYDFRPLKDKVTMDLIARLFRAPEGYYIGKEKFELKYIGKEE